MTPNTTKTDTEITLKDLSVGDKFKLMPFGKWYTVADFMNPGSKVGLCIASFAGNLIGAFDFNHIAYAVKRGVVVKSPTKDNRPRLLSIIHQHLPQTA